MTKILLPVFLVIFLKINDLHGQNGLSIFHFSMEKILPTSQFFKPKMFAVDFFGRPKFSQNFNFKIPKPATPACFLPKFSESDLPVFCKIEHRAAKKLPLAMKFRLGSVGYVDWLEGKTDWQY